MLKCFADGADIEEMKSAYKNQLVDGFTTNAGRIADTGIDPLPLMKESVKVTHSKEGVQLLWAS